MEADVERLALIFRKEKVVCTGLTQNLLVMCKRCAVVQQDKKS